MNKPLLVANWKMNPEDTDKTQELFGAIAKGVEDADIDVVLCPPFVYLAKLQISSFKLQIGAQDCFWEERGAFTGEVSPLMLKNVGCSYVILGHSERKNYLQETTDIISRKVAAALKAGLTPIICIGEKEKGTAESGGQVKEQMQVILAGVDKTDIKLVVLVYEPEWAISTNKDAEPAAPQDCKEAISYMREVLSGMFKEPISKETLILYGGSVNSSNIKEFLAEGEADGALIGGASLEAEEFIRLVKNAADLVSQ